jgi:CPA1 family monovalent cation:H+ antiporter
VWETVVFVLNVLAFVLIGLQVRPILEGLEPATRTRYLSVAAAGLVTVIVVRFAWVMAFNFVYRMRVRRYGFHPPRPMLPPTKRGALIIAWSGMRGVVTLAAALALPARVDGVEFPYRDLIVLTAFCIVLGTLVLQGLTLKPLVRALDLRDDDPVGREVATARTRAVQAALASLDGETSPAAESVRLTYNTVLARAGDRPADGECGSSEHDDLRKRALAAARQAASDMRASDEIGDDAFHRLEEELDWVEMSDAVR